MCESRTLAPEEATGTLLWKGGMRMVGGASVGVQPDLRIIRTRTLTGLKCEKGWLSMRLEPVVRAVVLPNDTRVEVQTFRCWSTQHQERWLMVCGTCGDLCFGDLADVAEAAECGCRLCGAGLAPVACITPHTFGSCLHCPETDPSQLLPFVGLSKGPLPVHSGASAEDRRSPQTGPPQTSNGLGPQAVGS